MKTTLDHLPEHKRQELNWAVELIVEAVKPCMIILFGSYARGDWVEELADDGVHYQYQSDFDILVLTKTESRASKIEHKRSLHNSLQRVLTTPVGLIAEDVELVNHHLKKGQYFFSDIQREGILLYTNKSFILSSPREPNNREKKKLAEEDFKYWNDSAVGFVKGFHFYLGEKENNKAAFLLHQATESFYNAVLLVYTRYKPKIHDLLKLSQRVACLEPQFLRAFPEGTLEEKERFELLRKAYVDARYSPSYNISLEELEWLGERVAHLKSLTEKYCQEKIANY